MSKQHSRREFLRASGVGLTALSLPHGSAAFGAGVEPARPPNILVIMADDLGAHELGCYGHPAHRTPNLDALGRTGVWFRTCYSTPICHPTRFMIMTGQYGHHNGVYHFAGRPGGPAPDDPAENITTHVTFAHMFKARGYVTALAGKWQLSGSLPDLVHEAGFDEYCMWAYKHNLPPGVAHTGGWEGRRGGKTSRYWHPSILRNGEYMPTGPDDYGPDIFADFAIDFMRRHRDRPFLVYYPMALTHAPYYTTPDTTRSPDDRFKHSKRNWQANVEYTDKLVGRITAALDGMGIRDRTVVFFTGDNGTGGNGKGQSTELGARVPMVVNGPGIVRARGATGELIDLSDILPTLAELAGAPLPADRPIDGQSHAAFLRGRTDRGPREWIYAYLGNGRVLRDTRWLLERNTPDRAGRFFDCGQSRDGTGYNDVTDSRAPEVVAARKRFEQILADKPVPELSEAGTNGGKRRAAGETRHGGSEISQGGVWDAGVLTEPDEWSGGFSDPVVSGRPDGLRVEVGKGRKRAVIMVPRLYSLPPGVTKVRLHIKEVSPGARWLFKLAGNHDGSGKITAAHVQEQKTAGVVVRELDPRVRKRPGESWLVKLGLTGPPGSSVVFTGVEFVAE